jgi:hypothetical protein
MIPVLRRNNQMHIGVGFVFFLLFIIMVPRGLRWSIYLMAFLLFCGAIAMHINAYHDVGWNSSKPAEIYRTPGVVYPDAPKTCTSGDDLPIMTMPACEPQDHDPDPRIIAKQGWQPEIGANDPDPLTGGAPRFFCPICVDWLRRHPTQETIDAWKTRHSASIVAPCAPIPASARTKTYDKATCRNLSLH